MSSIEERVDQLEQLVRDVVARDEIRELTADYCRQVMRGDGEGVVALFTDDASLVTHFPEGSGVDDAESKGVEALRESYSDLGAMRLKPCVHNHIVEVEGDTARSFSSVEIRLSQKGEPFTGAGHYEDEYRRVNGKWKFQRRELFVYHWVPYTEGWA